MASQALEQYKQAVTRLRGQIQGIRAKAAERGARAAQVTTQSLLTAAGGALSGVARAKHPQIGGYPTDAVGGLLLCGAALSDIAGEYSDEMNALGAGLLAGFLSREVEQAVLRAA